MISHRRDAPKEYGREAASIRQPCGDGTSFGVVIGAVMGKPDILTLNEPTSVLDVSGVKLREAGTNGWTVGIKEGTEYQIHLPYILNDFRNRYTTEMTDREFSYYISNLPVRHSIRVKAV